MSDRPKPTCPFCGAAPKENWTEKVLWFNCGTMVVANYNRHDQTTQCVQSEIGALKDRIERLEKAGDEMYRWITVKRLCSIDCTEAWNKAKEAKPCIKQLKTKSCIYCMKVECECSDFDVSADMGAKG